jgi:hypothetical protein
MPASLQGARHAVVLRHVRFPNHRECENPVMLQGACDVPMSAPGRRNAPIHAVHPAFAGMAKGKIDQSFPNGRHTFSRLP